jgi:hypothetical protein
MRTSNVMLLAVVCTAILLVNSKSVQAAADDNAGNAPYADGWDDGDNGGTGFGPWTSAFSGDPAGLVHSGPKFIDNGPLAGNSLGAPAFALTTSARPFFFDTSEVGRTLTTPLKVGQTFSVEVDGSALDPNAPGFSIGNTVQLLNAAGEERFGVFTNNQFNNDNWTATGSVDTGVAAGAAFLVELTLVTADTYDMTMRPIGGGAPLFSQTGNALSGTAGSAIDRIRISAYGTGSSADGSKELFFDNLAVVPEPSGLVLTALATIVGAVAVRRRKSR